MVFFHAVHHVAPLVSDNEANIDELPQGFLGVCYVRASHCIDRADEPVEVFRP